MLAILFTLFAAVAVVSAHVSVDNPLNGQYPLIARIGENYTWTMSSKTFSTDLDKSLAYSASGLPGWLNFDNRTLTFYGLPTPTDEGRPPITVNASDAESVASSGFILCVTPFPAPTVQKPISQQFYAGNPALSSVFFLSPGSALATEEPTLRVPARWSFSIGLDGDTFAAQNDLFYGALLSDGTPLPSWMTFDPETVTFDGVAPNDEVVPTPITLEIEVFGTDQEGYSALSLSFNLVVASHELSAYSSMPTVNVTAGTPFNVSMSSPADFSGILVDGQALQPANLSFLSVDVSSYRNWLKYDPGNKTLSGTPPSNFTDADGKPTLPVTLTTNFNQTLYTSVALDIVGSYFSKSDLGTIRADPGQTVLFNLADFFANPSSQPKDANLSASCDPSDACTFLNFNTITAQLTGRIPEDSDIPNIHVTFVAYSPVTHSTSHATLDVESPALESIKGHGSGGVGEPSKSQVTLIVSLVFGVIGGVFFLGFALALFRRCARVKDSAILGEEGTRAWTEEEKRWYGIGIEVREAKDERGYGWSNQADSSALSEKGSLETQAKEAFDPGYYPPARSYDNLGLGLRRVSPRAPTTPSTVQASCAEGVMKKAEFFGRIKNTARNVSDKYKRRSPPVRPIISHPVPLARRDDISGMPIQGQYVEIVKSPPHAESATSIRDDHLTEKRASTVVSFTTSPSNSTAERSIPRRRADFAPPNSPRGPRAPAPAAVRETARRR
jgi:axial budding pattern protein 2